MPTTAMAASAKSEFLSGAHCFNQTVTPTATAASASTALTSVSSMVGVVVGMAVSGTGIAANTVVAATPSASTMTLSIPSTAIITGGTLTISGDVFKIALIKVGFSGTYDNTLSNYGTGAGTPTTGNIGTDEVSGTGYTAGGFTLTNVSPTVGSGVGYTTFTTNPSWISSSFSTVAAVVYNTSARMGGVSGRVVSVHDLGGTQTVSAGTLTLVLPTASASAALIRLQ
jgi:hypothetical protein